MSTRASVRRAQTRYYAAASARSKLRREPARSRTKVALEQIATDDAPAGRAELLEPQAERGEVAQRGEPSAASISRSPSGRDRDAPKRRVPVELV